MALILASASPRRQELLRMLGLSFSVETADIDETMDSALGAEAEVTRICRAKADAVLPRAGERDVIVAADTVVCVDDRILGKPRDTAEAAAMLRLLSGRSHQVRTGVTVCSRQRCLTETETTALRFRPLSDAEIFAYIATGEPMDKAGAYGIQGKAAIFAEALSGDFFNVMGLPLCRLSRMLRQFGVAVLGDATTR
ncbi:MAG: Maf family protein [Oscillospiraceae bacterium]|nr:Maf family protein [Oscillospiraceae bacterium]